MTDEPPYRARRRGPGTRVVPWALGLALPALACGEPPPAAPVAGAGAGASEPVSVTSVPGLHNTLRWATRQEQGNAGFDVYRAEAPSGPFARLTAAPLPGAGTSQEPHAYEYVDRAIAPGTVYYYYVEAVTASGERRRVTPVIRAAAKAGTEERRP